MLNESEKKTSSSMLKIRVAPEQKAKVEHMATLTGSTQSHVMRALIDAVYPDVLKEAEKGK